MKKMEKKTVNTIELKLKPLNKMSICEECEECKHNQDIVEWYMEISGDPAEIKAKLSKISPRGKRHYLKRRLKFLDEEKKPKMFKTPKS